MRFQTKAIHAGQEPDETTGAVVPPLHQNVTFRMDSPGVHRGFDYTRTVNPTRSALERCLASLEGAEHAVCYSSGMAAEAAVVGLLRPGDHIVASRHIYAGTYRYFTKTASRMGIKVGFAATEDTEAVVQAIRPETRLVWMETPSNPLATISNIREIAARVHSASAEAIVVVDSTMASPYCQQPLGLGADIVLHSTTKYIAGHIDVLGGVLATSRSDLFEALFEYQNATGPTPSPFDNWLTLRGVRTLGVRMKAHQENAMAVAMELQAHPAVEWVNYPGLASHPQHNLALRQMSAFSGMVPVCLKGGASAAERFAGALRVFTLAESLGGVQSLVSHSATMTHASLTPEERADQDIPDGLLRLSVGLEDTQDLLEDIRTALAAV